MAKFLEQFITDLVSARAIGRILREREPELKKMYVPREVYLKISRELMMESKEGYMGDDPKLLNLQIAIDPDDKPTFP